MEFVSHSPQLLTLGIKPNRPETGYGYIQIDEEKQGDFFKVKTFIEKPQLEFAKVFVESGEFYWNSGIFLWNINTIINDAIEGMDASDIYAVDQAMIQADGTKDKSKLCLLYTSPSPRDTR